MNTPTNCFTTFARINTRLLDAIRETKKYVEDLTAWEVLQRVQQTQTRTVLPEGWKWK
jgi:hypothetical protein